MTDDPPIDLDAVAAEDAGLDALRTGPADDAALSLLRELLLDVERDLPDRTPGSHGSTLPTLAAGGPQRRHVRSGTVVALTAGLLSLGGVAAASTLVPAGNPLHGLGQAVRSAAGAAVDAVSPPSSAGGAGAALPTSTASPASLAPDAEGAARPRTPAPGATVSAASRSRAAARQVGQLLDAAAALLDDRRTAAAVARLDLAERKLTAVLASDRSDLPQRLADLRARATRTPAAKPGPATMPEEKASAPAAEQPAERSTPEGNARTAPTQKSDTSQGRSLRGQLSRDASMKPRA